MAVREKLIEAMAVALWNINDPNGESWSELRWSESHPAPDLKIYMRGCAASVLNSIQAALPELGFALVPYEATMEMLMAAARINHARDNEIYAACIAAAPTLSEDRPDAE